MSLEENKQLVLRYQEIFNEYNLDALSEVLADNLLTPRIMPGITTTGAQVDYSGLYMVRIKNGRIVEHWGEEDSVSLLTQLGAIPKIP